MKVEYFEKPEQSDPMNNQRYITIEFDKPEELLRLSRMAGPDTIVNYFIAATKSLLMVHKDAGGIL